MRDYLLQSINIFFNYNTKFIKMKTKVTLKT